MVINFDAQSPTRADSKALTLSDAATRSSWLTIPLPGSAEVAAAEGKPSAKLGRLYMVDAGGGAPEW